MGTTQGPQPDLILHPVVIDGYCPIIEITGQRRPSFQTVIDSLGEFGSVGVLCSLPDQPGMQFVDDRLGLLLPDCLPSINVHLGSFPPDLVEHSDGF